MVKQKTLHTYLPLLEFSQNLPQTSDTSLVTMT